ncbi:hypothetical protein KIW84_015810 [Lathyrus oleraceus]|uniref:Uncharacterized protein n=1 Tax=Pisum sativum TaxID=3888 RepID=A0A9D5H1D7_PEA|nr:hypothetical protein KIW84_015810 [Pisum sativum]
MINMFDLILDVAPLSMIHPLTQKKAMPYVSKNVKTSGKSSVSEPTIPSEDKIIVEEGSRSKGYDMKSPTRRTGFIENKTKAERIAIDKELRKFVTSMLKEVDSDVLPDLQTSLAIETIPDGDSSEKVDECVPEQVAHERRSNKKADECVPEQAAHERRSKKKADYIVNVDDLTIDEEPLTNILAHGIAKRLQRRKGKVVMFEDSPSKEIKRKSGGMKSTPSRSSKGKYLVGPTSSWSKVVTPTRKRKVVSSSGSELEENEVEHYGDDNVGADVEDYAGGNDAENDEVKEVEGEEYATTDSDIRKISDCHFVLDVPLRECFDYV